MHVVLDFDSVDFKAFYPLKVLLLYIICNLKMKGYISGMLDRLGDVWPLAFLLQCIIYYYILNAHYPLMT